jgi:uncharacterized glyoxalase superfamily protein PhnB
MVDSRVARHDYRLATFDYRLATFDYRLATFDYRLATISGLYDSLQARVKVVMPLETKWYGTTEFAFEDPDGYVITYAEREQT